MATSVAPRIGGGASDLLLKVTPPRVPRDLVVRPRLHADDAQFQGRAAIIVQAPAGFGKTLLLAQWRREHLAHGRIVAWLSAQAEDNPQRFVRSLALAVRMASGRQTFGHTLLAGAAPGGLEGITSWLAEVAQSALDIVLIVDSADSFRQHRARHWLICCITRRRTSESKSQHAAITVSLSAISLLMVSVSLLAQRCYGSGSKKRLDSRVRDLARASTPTRQPNCMS